MSMKIQILMIVWDPFKKGKIWEEEQPNQAIKEDKTHMRIYHPLNSPTPIQWLNNLKISMFLAVKNS